MHVETPKYTLITIEVTHTVTPLGIQNIPQFTGMRRKNAMRILVMEEPVHKPLIL
jgi:hypothetical protein